MFSIIRREKLINNDYFITTIKGTIGFFCPRCYKPIYATTDYKDNTHGTHKGEVCINLTYDINCPRCGYSFIWDSHPLDPNITNALAILNSKGYKTLFSCEGHYVNKCNDYAYIFFKYPNQRHVLKYIPIEKPWSLRKCEDNTFIIKPYNIKVLHKNSTAFCIEASGDTKLEDRINALNTWVKRLPECRTSIFYKKYLNLPAMADII